MSSYKDEFSAEELAALSLWKLPPVGESASSEEDPAELTQEEIEPAPRLTVEEIAAMQQQAYEEAAEQGRQEGYKAGYEEGYQQGQETVQACAAQWEKLLASLNEPFRELDERVEQELAALAMLVAKHLVRRELKTDPGQIVAVVREAIDALPSAARGVKLYLHPEDAGLVRSQLALDEASPAWVIVEEPLLARGGCRVVSATSRIDATVERRLAAIIATAMGGEREGDGER